jgi:heme oxygenase
MRQLASVVVRLNLETRGMHAAADRVWFELVANGRVPTRQEYMRTLVRVYGFEAPLEAALAYTPHFESLVDTTGRYRSGLIAQDLLTLALTPAQVADISQCLIDPCAGVAEALGWLYVHERATFAQEPVRRELIRRAPMLGRATSYLGAYAGVVGVRFDDLGRMFEQYGRTKALEDRICAGAHDAFEALLQWFDVDDAAVPSGHADSHRPWITD